MQDVINARSEADQLRDEYLAGEARYREAVRAALSDGVRQVDIAKAIDRTREMVRRDAMPEDQRAAHNQSRRKGVDTQK